MKDEPNAEAGLYPFAGCCEHPFRVHSSKACQIGECQCKRRRQLPRPAIPPEVTRAVVDAATGKGPAVDIVATVRPDGWTISHERFHNERGSLILTRLYHPDGDMMAEAIWDPEIREDARHE